MLSNPGKEIKSVYLDASGVFSGRNVPDEQLSVNFL